MKRYGLIAAALLFLWSSSVVAQLLLLGAGAGNVTAAAGVPTGSGTSITMNSFDNRSAYMKLIACEAV